MDDIEERLLKLETQVEMLARMVISGQRPKDDAEPPPTRAADHKWISGLTRNQHATLQMVVNGKNDAEICKRFGIGLSSAKSRVLQLRKRLGTALDVDVRNRGALMRIADDALEGMSDERYFSLSGLKRDWDQTWTPDDKNLNGDLY
tara:strand:+ start:2474 stop:2914 length:441 start_codon:yes stop_codon:yes gene_type:complete